MSSPADRSEQSSGQVMRSDASTSQNAVILSETISPPPIQPRSSSPAPADSSFTEALKSISPFQDLKRLPTIPCARYSLLFGIMAGASIGSLRFMFSRVGASASRWSSVGTAANWAVASWGVGSLGAWETCRRRQTAEQARMTALVNQVKARRAAKQQQSPAGQSGEARTAKERPPGGILIGETGREMLRQRELIADIPRNTKQ